LIARQESQEFACGCIHTGVSFCSSETHLRSPSKIPREKQNLQVSNVHAEYKVYKELAHYLQPPSSKHLRKYVLILPYRMLPLANDFVSTMRKKASKQNSDVLLAPNGAMLVRRSTYYPAAIRNLPEFFERGFDVASLITVMRRERLRVHLLGREVRKAVDLAT